MTPLFVDPAVLLLAVGGEHELRSRCRALLESAAEGLVQLHLSVEGGQEFLFHRMRVAGREAAVQEFDQLERLVIWHPFDLDVLRSARDLISRGHVRGRDAVHPATALAAGFDAIVSTRRDFDGIPGLARREPAT